jgi:hypothetical protein
MRGSSENGHLHLCKGLLDSYPGTLSRRMHTSTMAVYLNLRNAVDWTDWPAKRIPNRAILAWFIIAASVLCLTVIDPIYGVIGALILLSSASSALFPTRYRLTESGVFISNPLRSLKCPWSRFHRWRKVDGGVYFIAGSKVGWIGRRRSVFLPVTDLVPVRAYLADHVGLPCEDETQ